MYMDLAESRTIVEVADALALTDGAWSEPFLLFGHSRGGGISTITAAGFPERIRALIVCESVSPLRDLPLLVLVLYLIF